MEKNLVTVKGSMDAQKLVEFINKRGGRHAEIVKQQAQIVKQTNNEKKKERNENQNQNQNRTVEVYPNYPSDLVYAPQLFSDENPNSCLIM